MNKTANIKLLAYVLLAVGAVWCGIGFYRHYSRAMAPPPAAVTNDAPAVPVAAAPAPDKSRMMGYGAGLLVCILGLGLLAAYDLTHLFAHRVEQFVFEQEPEGERDPEYEEAERVWANGQHLEAIQLMRDYLKAKPREQYVALRIAEIYEKDLGNPVAAALEYEEILKKALPPERWGWAAVHLANLYSGRLNRVADAEALLRRIVTEHPATAAARKARERLGETGAASLAAASPSAAAAPAEAVPEERPHNLPPGFRPKS